MVSIENEEINVEEIFVEELNPPFEISPREFLEMYVKDTEDNNLRGLVNSLSNLKRALEGQLDSMLYNYCLYKISDQESWKFPKKIEELRDLGIKIPNSILEINSDRVELEHRYKKPSKPKMAEFFRISKDLIESTEIHTKNGVKKILGKTTDGKTAEIIFDRQKEQIEFYIDNKLFGKKIVQKDSDYRNILKLAISLNQAKPSK